MGAASRDTPELLADALSELGLARFWQGHGVEEELMRRALAAGADGAALLHRDAADQARHGA